MPLANYLRFAAGNPRLLGFGFLLAFASSFGQTFFIGVFGPEIQAELGLGHSAWGTVYMAGTLASAALLPWSGKLIDTVDLRMYTIGVCGLAVLACMTIAYAHGWPMLVVAIFALRHAGQGLLSHTAVTSMARYFEVGRGRAIAVAGLGFSVGEAVLPVIAVITIAAIGWRGTYGVVAALVVLALMPAVVWLLAGHEESHRAFLAERATARGAERHDRRSWTRAEVLRDPRFFLLMPGVLAPSVILTAVFFHHLTLADAKGWSHAWLTGSYVVFAGASVCTSITTGSFIDRHGAVGLVKIMLGPLVAGMLVISHLDSHGAGWLYLTLLGISTGIAHTAVASLWAEIYGVGHLGAVKSLAAALSVFASALGPAIMGTALDAGMTVEGVCLLFAAYGTLGTALILTAFARQPMRP